MKLCYCEICLSWGYVCELVHIKLTVYVSPFGFPLSLVSHQIVLLWAEWKHSLNTVQVRLLQFLVETFFKYLTNDLVSNFEPKVQLLVI
jgi:TRAP-type mannitol/chloroaromatic compound transport system permease large subunit